MPNYYDHAAAFKSETYSPQLFLNKAARVLGTENDSQLAKALGFTSGTISNIRNKKTPITAYTILRVMEATGWTVAEARAALRA